MEVLHSIGGNVVQGHMRGLESCQEHLPNVHKPSLVNNSDVGLQTFDFVPFWIETLILKSVVVISDTSYPYGRDGDAVRVEIPYCRLPGNGEYISAIMPVLNNLVEPLTNQEEDEVISASARTDEDELDEQLQPFLSRYGYRRNLWASLLINKPQSDEGPLPSRRDGSGPYGGPLI